MPSFTTALAAAAVFTVASLATLAPVQAMECPDPKAHDSDGVLAESDAQIKELASLMGTGDEENRIRVVAHDLMEHNKGVDRNEIVNYMAAVFCTEVAGNDGLSDSEKQAQIEAFNQQVYALE